MAKRFFTVYNDVNNAEVVSDGDGLTIIMRIVGGQDAIIETHFLVFTNKNETYRARRVPGDVDGVSHCTGSKSCTDANVTLLWLKSCKVMQSLPSNRRRIISVKNRNGHNETEALSAGFSLIRTKIRFFHQTKYTWWNRVTALLNKKCELRRRDTWKLTKRTWTYAVCRKILERLLIPENHISYALQPPALPMLVFSGMESGSVCAQTDDYHEGGKKYNRTLREAWNDSPASGNYRQAQLRI